MKLIIREYLSSLKERGELDAVLPDLLSQLGLNVYSRPARGTRQDGVDVGAVGSLDDGPEKVYLFSIKPGDLTRRSWDGDSEQSLRPSLNEIVDAYIPNRLPAEHRGKEVVICITIGGDVQEQVRPQLAGYIAQTSRTGISFEEWNGDKLAAYIQSSFLREDLLPLQARSLLRKSLAMLDEPDISFRHFSALIQALAKTEGLLDAQRLTAIRQMSICLWILFAWAREAKNMEPAYLASEVTLLHAWELVKNHVDKRDRTAQALNTAFISIFTAYNQICTKFLHDNVLPYTDKLHALSIAVDSNCSLDSNLKMFDVLGRLGSDGIWAYWGSQRSKGDQNQIEEYLNEVRMYSEAIKALITNNPALLLPAKDDQAIDILVASLLLATDSNNHAFIISWHGEIMDRARFSFETNGKYPCVFQTYADLLEHPKATDSDYRENATSASILYPTIALWAALLEDEDTYGKVVAIQRDLLPHCTFQLWFPDDQSEIHLYQNTANHGAALANLVLNRPKDEFLAQVFAECELSPHVNELSAAKFGWWPLVVIACRHHRLPLPVHFLEGLRKKPIGADE
jgi:hypothetical protein